MKKIIYAMVLLAGLLVSCSKKTTDIVITPENAGDVVVVNSDNSELADFFDVVPDTYEVALLNDTLQVELSFLINKEVREYIRGEFESFVLIPLNGESNALGEVVFSAFNGREMHDILFNAAEGTNVTVKFQYVPANEEEKEMLMNELTFCRVELNLADMVFEEVDDEPGYDDYMDMYIQAVLEGNEEVIMSTAETMAEGQMEGWLTPEEAQRWQNIDKEIENAKRAK